MKEKIRLTELDLLRFLASLAVMFYHRFDLSAVALPVYNGAQLGMFGVHLFFMISGFVILWSASGRGWPEFIASRVSRLYPSFLAALVLTTLVLLARGHSVPLKQFLANLTMMPNLLRQQNIDSVYWTLALEIRFYALMFLLVAFRQLKRIDYYLAAWLGICAVERFVPQLEILTLSQFAPYFAAGCLYFQIRKHGPTPLRWVLLAVSFGFALDVGIASAHSSANRFITPYLSAYAVGVVIALYGVFTSVALKPWNLPAWKLWSWLGAMTYPIYLLHYELGIALYDATPTWDPMVRLLVGLAMSLSLALIFAATTERYVCPAFNRWLLSWRQPILIPATATRRT